MQSAELQRLKLEWMAITNDEMPADVQRWPHWKITSAIRLLADGITPSGVSRCHVS